METTLIIFDSYLKNPNSYLKESRELSYALSGLNPSNLISSKSKNFKGFSSGISKIVGKKIKWGSESGTFRNTNEKLVKKSNNSFFCHSDGVYNFVTVLYLNADNESHGGTGFYRHRPTGLSGFHDLAQVQMVMKKQNLRFDQLLEIVEGDSKKSDKWELMDQVKAQFNRLLIFNGGRFHSHIFEFDKVKKNAQRLTFVCYGQVKNE